MTLNDIKVNWYYFRALAKQLHDTEQFVDHSLNSDGRMINGNTCLNEFAKILMLASAEFEIIAKSICNESGVILRWSANIVTITRELLKLYPNIGLTEVSTPYLTIHPLSHWSIKRNTNSKGNISDVVNGIDWWNAHNKVKHDRTNSFQLANLQSSIDALASLMVLELYLSQIVVGNLDLVTRVGCEYFDCNYGLSFMAVNPGHKLPDFVNK